MTQLSLFDPIEIQLTRGYVAIVDPVDSDLANYKWTATPVQTAHEDRYGVYAIRGAQATRCRLHRVVMERVLGRSLTTNEHVDHIDGNGLNCSRANLRIATRTQNQWNRRTNRNSRSGYKGVYWQKSMQKWQASISTNGKRISLGYYDTPEAAHEAYCVAARDLHGEFARFK